VGGQAERVWEHLLHEDGDFVQRCNFFLVGESMLVVAYAGIIAGWQAASGGETGEWKLALAARMVAVFGLLLTAVWGYVSHDQFHYLRRLRTRAAQHLPEYRELRATRPNRFELSMSLMTYGVPGLAGTLWTALAILV